MKAKVYSHKQLIGTADLRVGDQSMGCIYGDFIPNDTYFNEIRKYVWEFWSESKISHEKWHALRFNVQLDNGYFLSPVAGYTFDDIPELPDEPKRIDIMGLDYQVIEDFFLETPPRPFVEAPWEQITIEQKIEFEDQLDKEPGPADFKLSALCRCNNDVLFAVGSQDVDEKFAVIHLPRKGANEAIEFYTDFDEFKYDRMYPDKTAWES